MSEKMQYNFNSKPTEEDLKKIDTTSFYVQIFEGRYYNEEEKANPRALKFHNDGYFRTWSVKYPNVGKFTPRNSPYYGGKYRVIENTIYMEKFLPSVGGETSIFIRDIKKGRIVDDKIYIGGDAYQKKDSLK